MNKIGLKFELNKKEQEDKETNLKLGENSKQERKKN